MAKNEKKHFVLIKTVVILGLILFGLIIFAISKESYKKKQAQIEIDKLQQEAEKITRENTQLTDKISYLDSKDYQEKEARDKLNMQNPKENMVIVEPGLAPTIETQNANNENGKKLVVKTTNVQKWWDYFFKY
ncbi:MAG: septum formation initiator family protein [Parcubacteria group bacterium]|jgi:cell division protein FtsB